MVNVYFNFKYFTGEPYAGVVVRCDPVNNSSIPFTSSVYAFSDDWQEATTDSNGRVDWDIDHAGQYMITAKGTKENTIKIYVSGSLTGSVNGNTLTII